MEVLFKKVCGLDVHKGNIVASIVWEEDKERKSETREFGSMQSELEELKRWLDDSGVELVVMESTSIYWVPVYEKLEGGDYKISVVNLRLNFIWRHGVDYVRVTMRVEESGKVDEPDEVIR